MALPEKRDVDLHILADWIRPGSRVLDLGCGRGVLLEHLAKTRQVSCVGVDIDVEKVAACVRRGVPVYQGDLLDFMRHFPDAHFDTVICSRTVQELPEPGVFLSEAVRVGKRVAIGFVNYGYWKNRWHIARTGARLVNDVHPFSWRQGRLQNPVSLREFEEHVTRSGLRVLRRIALRGDWRTQVHWLPNLRAGYALFEIGR